MMGKISNFYFKFLFPPSLIKLYFLQVLLKPCVYQNVGHEFEVSNFWWDGLSLSFTILMHCQGWSILLSTGNTLLNLCHTLLTSFRVVFRWGTINFFSYITKLFNGKCWWNPALTFSPFSLTSNKGCNSWSTRQPNTNPTGWGLN